MEVRVKGIRQGIRVRIPKSEDERRRGPVEREPPLSLTVLPAMAG